MWLEYYNMNVGNLVLCYKISKCIYVGKYGWVNYEKWYKILLKINIILNMCSDSNEIQITVWNFFIGKKKHHKVGMAGPF